VQKDSDKGTIEHQSTEEAELSAWAFAQLRGLLSPSDIEKLLSLLKVNNVSSLLLLKSMPEADLFKVSIMFWLDRHVWMASVHFTCHMPDAVLAVPGCYSCLHECAAACTYFSQLKT
jgi:hypothetical protein